MIISLHIPKTGGTSFAKILESVYGEHLWTNYDCQWNSAVANKANIPPKSRCIHGHFEFDAFDSIFTNSLKIVWLRDPIERTISYYNHIMSNPDYNNEIIMDVYNRNLTLEEFSGISWVSNNAMNYLKGAQPSDFHFIGFTETFFESLKQCSKILEWKKVPSVVWYNRGKNKTLTLSNDVRNLIHQNNLEEYNWIEAAKKLFNSKCNDNTR